MGRRSSSPETSARCCSPSPGIRIRLTRRGRLLDEVASESDISDRNIDFLVNRLRTKLGDSAKSPKYIATQYGEGYVWIAASSSAAVGGFLVIGPAFGPQGHPFSQQASSLVAQLRDKIAAGVGRKVVGCRGLALRRR
ncbi:MULTISPECIES: winged helix-turn-helix domain-containing protein [Bradyrhizobium]|uniref:Winged helix-turn-helix domain-containing protein n=1 Tax=Bradyrhizobium vignae TaxID=1549949 RepID=A0ABS4A4X7_9BRAD|nr:helix-turn-helix domain-containing protein [Bradyrhizobium vignae]MBP0115464.1 winged helix-turn-helix domain-containing protein [Bradyrhizobium vignae]RXH07233.1 winged helix family transcriptional regulator [Bradyrhizobium vignae]